MSTLRYHLRLYLVRHGESTNNALTRTQGYEAYMLSRSNDPLLSDTGLTQAQAAAPHVARLLAADRAQILAADGLTDGPTDTPVDTPLLHRLNVSPMWRALQTVQPIAQILEMAPEVRTDIFEHGGIFLRGEDGVSRGYPGADRAKILADFPDYILPDEITDQGWWQGDEEDLAACHARAIRVAHGLREEADAAREAGERRRAVMVSHGTFMDALIKAILGQLPSYAVYYYHNNTGITCIDFNKSNVALRFMNRCDHLVEPDMLTY
jgi:broad specificity phosphatase PhoE